MTGDYKAAFDCLVLIEKLEQSLGDAYDGEVQLFAYLAALLSLFRGWPTSDWGYYFASTGAAAPFSPDVAQALAYLVETGRIERDQSTQAVTLTHTGRKQIELLSGLNEEARRVEMLSAACNVTATVTPGLIRAALESDTSTSFAIGRDRNLLAEGDAANIHRNFLQIAARMAGTPKQLGRPALIWLGCLLDRAMPNLVTQDRGHTLG